jgi:hypothetical protein
MSQRKQGSDVSFCQSFFKVGLVVSSHRLAHVGRVPAFPIRSDDRRRLFASMFHHNHECHVKIADKILLGTQAREGPAPPWKFLEMHNILEMICSGCAVLLHVYHIFALPGDDQEGD